MLRQMHDAKSAMHVLREHGITLRGVQHDPLLYSYLLDPTYSTYALREVALRRFNLKLGRIGGRSRRHHAAPDREAARADRISRADARYMTTSICPWSPVLARMEDAGIKIDCDVLAEMSTRLDRE